MTWLGWLGLAAIVTGIVAVLSVQPKGTRLVSHTHLMGVARLALLALVVIFAFLAFRTHAGN